MNERELQRHLYSLRLGYDQLRNDLHENDAATNRRKAKKRETEVDTKPPLSPVRVAEPSKPRKPKYSGNHAPSTRR